MDDLFKPTSVAKDLLGLGDPWASKSGSISSSASSGRLGTSLFTSGTLNLAHMQPVDAQISGLSSLRRHSTRLSQGTMVVTLELGWQSPRGAGRSASFDVEVTDGSDLVAIAGEPCLLTKPARLVNGVMYACNLLGSAVERAAARQVERENRALDPYEGEFGVPVGSLARPERQGGDVAGRWSMSAPLMPRNDALPGGLRRLAGPVSASAVVSQVPDPGFGPRWEQGLAEERERKELRRLGMAPIRELLAAPAGVPATEFRYHAGIVDVVYGRHRVKVVVNATTGGVVMDGRTRLPQQPARKVGDTIWVSRDVLDLAKAADEAAEPFAFRARGFDGLGLLTGPETDGDDEPISVYRAPDGLITSLVDAFAKRAPDNALSVALAHRWHSIATHMALARLEGRLVRPVRAWFMFNQPGMEFWAGAGDSLTVVGTRSARAVFTGLTGWPDLDAGSPCYQTGEWAEFAIELLLCSVSAALKAKLRERLASSSLTWQQLRGAEFRFSTADRQWARARWESMGRSGQLNMHHANTLMGHSRYRNSIFPTGGLGSSVANSRWNIELLAMGREHTARHQALQRYEDLAAGLVNRQTIVLRAGANLLLSDDEARF